MKRKILAMGGVLAIVAASGAAWLMLAGSGEPKTLAAYWDGAAAVSYTHLKRRLRQRRLDLPFLCGHWFRREKKHPPLKSIWCWRNM